MKGIKNPLAIITAVLLIGGAIWYSVLIAKNEVQPSVATFFLVLVYLGISELTYWAKHPKAKLEDNVALHAGFINVVIVFVFLFIRRMQDDNLIADLMPFHWLCLILSGFVLIGWKITKYHSVGYCLMQAIALIAYLPTIDRVLGTEIQTESNVLWLAILIAGLSAIPSAWKAWKKKGDWLSLVYLGRVIPSNLVVVFLIFEKDLGWWPF